jgi:cobaltochelatase CobN
LRRWWIAFEKAGLLPLPIFGWPVTTLRPYLEANGKCTADVILASNLGFSKNDDAEALAGCGAPVINLLVSRDSQSGWESSEKGINPERVSNQLNAPERMGANEPILFAATEKIEGSEATRSVPIVERVDMTVRRAQRWIALRNKENANKRVAFVYYSNPPGKGFLGASYLNLMPSLLSLLAELQRNGYVAGDLPTTEKKLVALLHRTGRNIEQWAPGELDEIATQGIVLIPVKSPGAGMTSCRNGSGATSEKVSGAA